MTSRTIGLAVLATLATGEAHAQTSAYVGTWASNPLQCLIDQSLPAAPLIFGKRRYDQHEAHCTFTSVTRIAPTRGACAQAAVSKATTSGAP